MPPVFREIPPLELVERFLMAYSLRGFNDSTWFTKKTCNLACIEELLPEILPYYTPCMVDTSISMKNSFKILRHLLRAHAYDIRYIEKSCRGKELWYQLATPFKANTEVFFD